MKTSLLENIQRARLSDHAPHCITLHPEELADAFSIVLQSAFHIPFLQLGWEAEH